MALDTVPGAVMQLSDRNITWKAGEVILWDDSYEHEVKIRVWLILKTVCWLGMAQWNQYAANPNHGYLAPRP